MCDPWAGDPAGAGMALSPFLCLLPTWTLRCSDPTVAGFASEVEAVAFCVPASEPLPYSVGRGNYEVPPRFKGRGHRPPVLCEGVST